MQSLFSLFQLHVLVVFFSFHPCSEAVTLPKFDVGDPAGAEYLREHGVCVFRNAATPAQVRKKVTATARCH
jgi:hypothetical protein